MDDLKKYIYIKNGFINFKRTPYYNHSILYNFLINNVHKIYKETGIILACHSNCAVYPYGLNNFYNYNNNYKNIPSIYLLGPKDINNNYHKCLVNKNIDSDILYKLLLEGNIFMSYISDKRMDIINLNKYFKFRRKLIINEGIKHRYKRLIFKYNKKSNQLIIKRLNISKEEFTEIKKELNKNNIVRNYGYEVFNPKSYIFPKIEDVKEFYKVFNKIIIENGEKLQY